MKSRHKKLARRAGPRAPRFLPEGDHPPVYTIAVVAKLSGLSRGTIVEYLEHGLVAPLATGTSEAIRFDEDALRLLRRIAHLRLYYGMEPRGLKLTLGLLDELERLQNALRSRR